MRHSRYSGLVRSTGLLVLITGCDGATGSAAELPPLSLEQLAGNWYPVNADGGGDALRATELKFLLGPRGGDTQYCDATSLSMQLHGEVLAVSASCHCIRTWGNPACTGMPPPSFQMTNRYRASLLAPDLFVSIAGSAGREQDGTVWIAGSHVDGDLPWSVELAPDGSAVKNGYTADSGLRWRQGFGRGQILFRIDPFGQPQFDSDIFVDSDDDPTIGGRGAFLRVN